MHNLQIKLVTGNKCMTTPQCNKYSESPQCEEEIRHGKQNYILQTILILD